MKCFKSEDGRREYWKQNRGKKNEERSWEVANRGRMKNGKKIRRGKKILAYLTPKMK